MKTRSPRWRPGWRLWFLLAAVVGNGALALWFFLPRAKTSPLAQEQERLAKAVNPEPILFKKRVQEHLAKETVEQSIEHLPNFDDTVPNMVSLGNTMWDEHSYGYSIFYYPGLNRVRKIIEEGRANPGRVTPILKDKLAHAMDDYKRLVVTFWKEFMSRKAPLRDWRELDKRRITTSCSVYLLAQLEAYDALPLMAKLFIDEGDTAKLFAKGDLPYDREFFPESNTVVNRLFLFCAMHQLVSNHPRDKLSPEALKRLDEYLAFTKEVPAFPEVSVPSWRAAYEAWDYRIMILGKDIGMDKQPHTRVVRFPVEMRFLESQPDSVLGREVLQWFTKMQRFIEAAYPTGAKSAANGKGGPS